MVIRGEQEIELAPSWMGKEVFTENVIGGGEKVIMRSKSRAHVIGDSG